MRTPDTALTSPAVTGPGAVALDVQHRALDVFGERQRERLQVADDLVHVLDDPGIV